MLLRYLLVGCLTACANLSLCAQAETEILGVIRKVFDGMRLSDTTLFTSAFHPSARFLSTSTKNGKTVHEYEKVEDFTQAIVMPRADIWDEQIKDYEIRIDDGVATAWMNYSFYVGTKFSHCGVNAITLIHTENGWKITEITDTRRIAPCTAGNQDSTKKLIHQVLDGWHRAAAIADEDAFFGVMTADAIYLGTDATERWLRDELKEWSKEYFKRDKAWAFTCKKREIYLHASGNTAWFEESLNTQMGECRGSGVLTKEIDGWKIRHYNLTLPIPNEKMDSVKALLEGKLPIKKGHPIKN